MKAIYGWRMAAAPISLGVGLALAGCGTPGAPLPPSLKLPVPVADLTAMRTGNEVSLNWVMPKKTTDKLLIKGKVAVRVCRGEGAGQCTPAPGDLAFAPGAHASFEETLPAALTAGAPRALSYFVELKNSKGRSAGLSNAAPVLAGEAPLPVAALSAQVRKEGILLNWDFDPNATSTPVPAIRLHRRLLTPQPNIQAPTAGNGSTQGILAPAREPLEQSLLVEPVDHASSPLNRTLDKSIRFGQTYEYRAQRVARVTVGSETFELAGPLSDPVRVEAIDVFPPAVPTGLAAVATAGNGSAGPSIDLSWQPVAEADVAGYAVYRCEINGPWQRISSPQPVVGPGFHDPQVQPGHTYRYAVTAFDQGGHESARSDAAEETVPKP